MTIVSNIETLFEIKKFEIQWHFAADQYIDIIEREALHRSNRIQLSKFEIKFAEN